MKDLKEKVYNNLDRLHNIVYTMYIRKEMTKMPTSIQKWGNSQGVRIPKTLLDTLNWKENEKIIIVIEDGNIVLKKAEEGRKNIKELFKDYKGKYEPINIDWGETVGEEIW